MSLRTRILKIGYKYQPEVYQESKGWMGFSTVFHSWSITSFPKTFWCKRNAEKLLQTTLQERDADTYSKQHSLTTLGVIIAIGVVLLVLCVAVAEAIYNDAPQDRADVVARCRSVGGEMGGEHCYVNGKILEEE